MRNRLLEPTKVKDENRDKIIKDRRKRWKEYRKWFTK